MLLIRTSDILRQPQRLAVWRQTGLTVLFTNQTFNRLTFPAMAASILAQLPKLASIHQSGPSGLYRIEPPAIHPV